MSYLCHVCPGLQVFDLTLRNILLRPGVKYPIVRLGLAIVFSLAFLFPCMRGVQQGDLHFLLGSDLEVDVEMRGGTLSHLLECICILKQSN